MGTKVIRSTDDGQIVTLYQHDDGRIEDFSERMLPAVAEQFEDSLDRDMALATGGRRCKGCG